MEKFRYILMLAAVAFATACQDEELIQEEPTNEPAAVGDEVVFGARAGFEDSDPSSRTVYTGITYNFGGKKYEQIDWVIDTDKVEIYSPQASAPGTDDNKNSHYIIKSSSIQTGTGSNKDEDEELEDHVKNFATLQRIGESSLQWQNDDDHTFYAMYPSERMFDTQDDEGNDITVDMGVELNETTLKGVVPNYQNPIDIKETDSGYEAIPDMRYAYMAAKAVAKREQGKVALTFIPFVTAVEIELTLADNGTENPYKDVSIGEIQITTTDGKPIAGDFSAELGEWDGISYPTCQAGTNKETLIQITTRKFNSASGIDEPITLEQGQSLKFTVFMLPTQDLGNLVVKFSGEGAVYRAKTLNFTDKNVSIPAHLKTRVSGLKLPASTEEITIDASNWMSQLDQNTSMRKLSLPGTGGSFSYNYKTEADKKYYSQQTLTLEEQWKLGIRAFEVIVNRPSSSTTSLGGQEVKCNKTSVNVTFNEVMTDLTTWVSQKYPNECAVVILTYQPEGASPNRNGAYFAGSLNTWYSSFANKDVLKKYTPDLTLGDAKGHVMVLVRLNQKDEKENGGFWDLESSIEYGKEHYNTAVTTLANTPFVLINGCGTAKDRWGARGYKVNDTNFPHISNSYSGYNIIETFMEEGYLFSTTDGSYTTSYTSGDYKITRAAADTPSDLNFAFETNDASTKCWYQEWARVVSEQGVYSNFYWFESYYEKLNNATVTYDMAVSNGYQNYIFINSLCGYLVTSGFADSYNPSTGLTYGGSGGDIEGLAKLITPAFYNHVYKRSQENTTGPTGIVMMDYLSDNPDDGGAYYLPGLIIANNFKHNK